MPFGDRAAEAITPVKYQITINAAITDPGGPVGVAVAVDGGEVSRVRGPRIARFTRLLRSPVVSFQWADGRG
jgi:hypothetical protein